MADDLERIRDTNGNLRVLGLRPPLPGADLPRVKFTLPIAPQSDWQEFDLTELADFPLVIKDQGDKGACNGFATAEAMELVRWLRGQPHVALSGWFTYAILCNGIDRGSSISEALMSVTQTGVAPDSDVAYGTIDPAKLTQKSYTDALYFLCEVGEPLSSWEQIMSAVQFGLGVNLSICVGGAFTPDEEGVVNVTRGPGNHAITAGHGAKRLKNGQWAIRFQNHWTPQWGWGGYAFLTEKHWVNQTYREAWAIRTPVEDTSDSSTPPTAIP